MFGLKLAVGQYFINTVLYLFGSPLQFHFAQLSNNSLCLFSGCFLTLLGMDRLKHFSYQLYPGTENDRKYIAVEMDGTAGI